MLVAQYSSKKIRIYYQNEMLFSISASNINIVQKYINIKVYQRKNN